MNGGVLLLIWAGVVRCSRATRVTSSLAPPPTSHPHRPNVALRLIVEYMMAQLDSEMPGLKRGRPLFLNPHRYQTLKQLYLRHRIAREVSAIRASLDRVIRENYY